MEVGGDVEVIEVQEPSHGIVDRLTCMVCQDGKAFVMSQTFTGTLGQVDVTEGQRRNSRKRVLHNQNSFLSENRHCPVLSTEIWTYLKIQNIKLNHNTSRPIKHNGRERAASQTD